MSPTIPKTCKAVVLEGAGAPWAIKEVPVHEPERGEVLIKVHACGVCHSDSFLQAGAFGPMGTFPRIPGHESLAPLSRLASTRGNGRLEIRSAGHGMEAMMELARLAGKD